MQQNVLPSQVKNSNQFQISNGTHQSNTFTMSNKNNTNLTNGLSDIRQEQQINSNKIQAQESLFPPATGSSLLRNQQFLQSNLQAKSEIKQQQGHSSVLMNPNYYNLIQSKPIQEKSGQLVQSKIVFNQSNINSKDNWGGRDYIKQFEEQNNIIQDNIDYLSYLSTLSLEIPHIKVMMKELLEKRGEIVKVSNTQKKQVYECYIQPRVQDISVLTEQLEASLQQITQIREIPFNPYREGNEKNSKIQGVQNLQQLLFSVESELKNKQHLIKDIIKLINEQQNTTVLVSVEQQNDSYQQRLERASEEINEFLRDQLPQTMNQVFFIQEREMFHVSNEVSNQINQQNMNGILYFSQKLQIIDGQMQLLYSVREKIKNYRQELQHLKNNFTSFQSFFQQIEELFHNYTLFIEEVKQIPSIPNEPIIQRYQVKVKTKCTSLALSLRKEISLLYHCGRHILGFNLEQKLQEYHGENVEAQVLYIRQFIEQLDQQYLKRGFQCPLEEAKKLKDLLFKAEQSYQKTDKIREELEQLEQQDFIGYKNYVANELKPQFTIQFRKQLLDDFYQIIYFQFADAIVLQTVKELIQFQFPLFDWNENIEDEKQRISNIELKHQDVKQQLHEYCEEYSLQMKFMKQLSNWENELSKCLLILKQYLTIKETLGNEKITLMNWPSAQFEPITEFSVLCEQIIRQTNQHHLAIEQLNSLNLISNVRIILKGWNDSVKAQLLEICQYIHEREFSFVIADQVHIAYEFIYTCMAHINEDVDEGFCKTLTYAELEEQFSGMKKFQEMKSIYDNVYNVELRYQLFEIIEQFMKEKTTLDFQNLFQLKLIQCQSGNSEYDPYKLALRTDLLYPLNRSDILDNQYCKQNMDRIKQYIDQPELRAAFQEFRELLNHIISILDQDNTALDIQTNQSIILSLANTFESNLQIQKDLTDISQLKRFHEKLLQWPKFEQLENQLIPLGIVLHEEYKKYLSACRKRIMRLVNGICIEIDSIDVQAISTVRFQINDFEFSLRQMDQELYYRDVQSIIIKYSPMKIQQFSDLTVKVNDRVLQSEKIMQL